MIKNLGMICVPLFIVIFSLTGCSRDVYLLTADGVSLAYEYQKIPGAEKTAVLVHGLGSDRGEWEDFAKILRKSGWSTLALDLRGHGASTQWTEGDLDWHEFTPEASKTSLQDLKEVMSMLTSEPHIWLIGSSFGANLSLQYAAEDPRIEGVVLLTPGINYRGIQSEPALKNYRKRPILIAASEDEPGAVDVAQWLFGLAEEPKKLILNDQGGHGTQMLDFNESLKKEIIEWMNQSSAQMDTGQSLTKK